MLLGHWYLVQPGLRRDALKELVVWTAIMWPFEVAVFLWPTGMVQMFNGTVDDGYDGLLGWVWLVCAITTIGLVAMTWFALQRALLLRGDGRDRPAVPRDPHRLRHGPHRPRRPRPVTPRLGETARNGGNSRRTGQTTKYLASGWGTMIADVDCSGTRWNSSVSVTPMRSISSSSATFACSSRSGHAG